MAAPKDSLPGLQKALQGCVDSDESVPGSKLKIVSLHSVLGYAESFTRSLGVEDVESTNSLLEEVSGRLDAHLDSHPVHDLSQKKTSFNADVGSCDDIIQAVKGRLSALQELEEAEKANLDKKPSPPQGGPNPFVRQPPPPTQSHPNRPQPSQPLYRPSQPRVQSLHQPPPQYNQQFNNEPDLNQDLGRAVSRSVFCRQNENRRTAGPKYTPRAPPRVEETFDEEEEADMGDFSTAKQLLSRKSKDGGGWRSNSGGGNNQDPSSAPPRRLGGGKRRGGFNPPYKKPADNNPPNKRPRLGGESNEKPPEKERNPILDDERVQGMDEAIVEKILLEILEKSPSIAWDDIAGLEFAKATVKEIVIAPMLRPDIFTGLRAPPRGLLLFGPPGTGKTLIGRVIASQSRSTFFSISASSLTSKWIGEGEKLVRALFAVARILQPSVIFVDEIDSLLSSRSEGEQEASRRLKTEFLVQMDGAATDGNDRLLLIGATNRPQELDEAMRRRLVKRLYIPLPDASARRQLMKHLLKGQSHSLADEQFDEVVVDTDGYSGFDINALCKEAALGPLRMVGDIATVDLEALPPISLDHFKDATRQVRPSVSDKDLDLYLEWNRTFGSFPNPH